MREIEHGAGDRLQHPGGDQGRIHRRVVARRQGEALVEHAVHRALPGEVEEGMIGQVDHGRGIGGG